MRREDRSLKTAAPVIAALIVAACSVGAQASAPPTSLPSDAPAGTQTLATAGNTAAPTAGSVSLPFEDGFSDPGSGWPTGTGPDLAYQIAYADDALVVLLNRETTAYTRVGFRPPVDTLLVAVQAKRVEGLPAGGTYGPTCHVDEDDFYAFYVGEDGRHGVVRVEDNVETILARKPSGTVTPLRAGEENEIRALCLKAVAGPVNLTLYVNGSAPLLVAHDDLPLGDTFSGFGLGAASDTATPFGVLFDDFLAGPGS